MALYRDYQAPKERSTGGGSMGEAIEVLLAIGQEQAKRRRVQEAMSQVPSGAKVSTTYDAQGYPVPTIERQVPTDQDQLITQVFRRQIEQELRDGGGYGGAGSSASGVRTKRPANRSALQDMITVGSDGKPRLTSQQEREKANLDRTKGQIDTTLPLRKEFYDQQEVKDYVVIDTKVRAMDAVLKEANSGKAKSQIAFDQAIISLFNKVTDPQSVVRESEYARTPGSQGVVNQMLGAIEKFRKGGAGLTAQDREALVMASKLIANEYGRTFNDRYDEMLATAEGYGVDADQVLGNRGKFEPYELPMNQEQGRSTYAVGQVISVGGRRYRVTNADDPSDPELEPMAGAELAR